MGCTLFKKNHTTMITVLRPTAWRTKEFKLINSTLLQMQFGPGLMSPSKKQEVESARLDETG